MSIIDTAYKIIPEEINNSLEKQAHARNIINFYLLMVFWGIFFTLLYTINGYYIGPLCNCIGLVFGTWIIYRITKGDNLYKLGSKISAALYLTQIITAYTSGGIYAYNILWFATIPVISLVIASIRDTIIWMLIIITSLAALTFCEIYPIQLPNMTDFTPLGKTIVKGLADVSIISVLAFTIYSFRVKQQKIKNSIADSIKSSTGLYNKLQRSHSFSIDIAHISGKQQFANFIKKSLNHRLSKIEDVVSLLKSNLFSNSTSDANKLEPLLYSANYSSEFLNNTDNLNLLHESLLNFEKNLKTEYSNFNTGCDLLNLHADTINNFIIEQRKEIQSTPALYENISVHEIISDSIDTLHRTFLTNKISCNKNFDETIKNITTDRFKFKWIIIELLNNSIDSMQDSSNKKISFKTEISNNVLAVTITDSGCGIPQEIRNSIFTQGISTKKEHFGFGLHTCANYLDEMNGSIEFISYTPGNTSCRITVPSKEMH